MFVYMLKQQSLNFHSRYASSVTQFNTLLGEASFTLPNVAYRNI